ncbi:uncharacterized protein LOC117781928 [Drosophila innubila]|uniref:uncharacterized protein LOC117781928 n=1 Tax=Drosophila innubila TaxID=198719 RepID=UPI00148BEAC0|nr:uncharacterized protein LOC117781928 [Drosophila innubila]
MSAYNRKVLMKMCSSRGTFDADSAMDESGYASFKALHNSTVEAPFLIERDCETENCRNASNTNTTHATATNQLHKTTTTFNSMQFQTPSSSNEFNSNSNTNTTLWHKSLSLPTANDLQLEDDDGMCKSPLPMSLSLSFSNQLPCANKRRKTHFQPMAHHSSPKKSKKKLFPQPSREISCRTRYYNNIDKLDIIGMLINTLPALECIFTKLNSHTLDVMTKVSERWAQSVYKSQRAVERLQNHRFKMSLTKENTPGLKRVELLPKSKNQIVPLQASNAIHKPNRHDSYNYRNAPMEDNCLLVEQMQRIKCPRCGKCSKVFYSQAPEMPRSALALSQTLPFTHTYTSCSFNERKPSMTRFLSLDEVKSSSNENPIPSIKSTSVTFGECTSIQCKFRFCVQCCCPPHPGEKCRVTEMGTPSKIMMPSETVTPPKRTQKYDSKLSRKKSLKRLNF